MAVGDRCRNEPQSDRIALGVWCLTPCCQTLESDHLDDAGKTKVPERPTKQKREQQRTLFAPEEHPIMDELRHLDVNNLTPLAALQELNRLKERLK